MALTCNIDARGKAMRLRIGIGMLVVGIAMIVFWALPANTSLAWIASAGMLASAAGSIFEARAGWCVLRAMGVRTPL